MYVIGLINPKGGVGKTWICAHVGGALAARGLKVLLIDADPQGTLSQSTAIERSHPGTAELLGYTNPDAPYAPPLASLVQHSTSFGCDVIASNLARLKHVGPVLQSQPFGMSALSKAVGRIERGGINGKEYDYVLIDTPGNLEILTLNGILASDGLIIPSNAGGESLYALDDVYPVIRNILQDAPEIKILGAVVTQYNKQATVDKDILDAVIRNQKYDFPFVKTIRHSTTTKDAFIRGEPMEVSSPKGSATEDLRALAETIITATEGAVIAA
jgi:chromosome partitioning protein